MKINFLILNAFLTISIFLNSVIPAFAIQVFKDISPSPFKLEILSLQNERILGGYPDGTFQPTRELNRGEMSKLIFNSLNFKQKTDCDDFVDVSRDNTFYVYIKSLRCLGVVGGFSDGSFRPEQIVNHLKASKFLINGLTIYENSKNGGELVLFQNLDQTLQIARDKGIMGDFGLEAVEEEKGVQREYFAKYAFETINAIRKKENKPLLKIDYLAEDVYNCDSFENQEQAQRVFLKIKSEFGRDIHGLDKNSNNVACEDFSNRVSTDAPKYVEEEIEASSFVFKNCTEVRSAGADPIYRGDKGFSDKLDRDGDGVACE
jgi:hypothetical protein